MHWKNFVPPTSSDGLCLLSISSSSFCMEADFPMYNSESKSEPYKICTPHRLFQLYLGVDQHFFHSVNFFRQIIRQQICCTLMGSSFPCSIFWTVRVLSWRPHRNNKYVVSTHLITFIFSQQNKVSEWREKKNFINLLTEPLQLAFLIF